jgi:hypothetical protein
MFSRFAVTALVLGILTTPMAWAHEGDKPAPAPAASNPTSSSSQSNPLSVERTCQFRLLVPPVLDVSECKFSAGQDGTQSATIDVKTNAKTTVFVDSTGFVRQERDCDGKLLDTKDTLNAALAVSFVEIIHCTDGGSPLQVKTLSANNFCIASHRGGYQILLSAKPENADICDDAGCYTATVRVVITAQPSEDCKIDP